MGIALREEGRGKVGPETKAASKRTNRGSHGRKGCVIRVPDEGTSGERSNEQTKRMATCTGGGGQMIRHIAICEIILMFSTNYVNAMEKKETTATATVTATLGSRNSADAYFQFRRACELAGLARDRPLSLPAVNFYVCVWFLPSFLPPSLFLFTCVSRIAELRTYYASIEFYFDSKSSLETNMLQRKSDLFCLCVYFSRVFVNV